MHFHSIDSLKKEITTKIISACFPERERERNIPPKNSIKKQNSQKWDPF
jgi:hypothetical protein